MPDKYYREGIHYVTLENNKWTQVVWEMHPSSRWLWLMSDLLGGPIPSPARSGFDVSVTSHANGQMTIRVTVRDSEIRTLELRSENLAVSRPSRRVTRRGRGPGVVEWRVRRANPGAPVLAVVIPDGSASRRREVVPTGGRN